MPERLRGMVDRCSRRYPKRGVCPAKIVYPDTPDARRLQTGFMRPAYLRGIHRAARFIAENRLRHVRRQKEWQFSGPALRYGFAPSGPCG